MRLSSPQATAGLLCPDRGPGSRKQEAHAVSAKVSLADWLVLLSFSGVLFLPLGLWYWLAYPPVQHSYLGAYFESAFVGDHSTMAVPVQWLSRGSGPVLPWSGKMTIMTIIDRV